MIKIAIADDEKEFVKKVEKITRQYFASRRVDYKIDKYLFSGELLMDVEQGKYFDIYLIDIEMPIVDGWDLANEIRKKYSEPYIIFVTSHLEYSIMGYEYNAWRYITKDTIHEKLPLAFESLTENLDCKDRKYYVIETPSSSFKINHDDIYYLHKEGKYTIVYTRGKRIKVRKALNKIFEELNGEEFLFADRSHIVNMRHVVGINSGGITMRDGTDIDASVTQYPKVKKIFNEFWGDER